MLRSLTYRDWPAVHDWARLPEACRYQAWGPNTPEQTRDFVREAARPSRTRFVFAVLDGDEVAGIGELNLRGPHQAEIGYGIHPDRWGRGLATAAARRLVDLAFAEHARHRVFATCDPRNVASARVLRKLGLRHEGRMRETELIRDGWRDSDLYAVLSHEWTGS
ncbi:GNAT family N-acetyltransferase [Actinoplanes aureus]|uniref:GNAT family N-acetyltransferase n=1 Tax=Actinoplanes aureus TaxID=2792083 RepID=A0A931C6U3_9ACTN|nr:GNAT family N-acetyltransferase [Actinoplanes aureus]MBG0564485.1 GNAT family N-acetyltransferase [Actinoplanes aureus]